MKEAIETQPVNVNGLHGIQALKGLRVGYEADLWALGCVLYQMLMGKPPFKAASEFLTFQKIQSLEVLLPDSLPSDACSLIKALLAEDPLSRLGELSQEGVPVSIFFSCHQHSMLQFNLIATYSKIV